MPTVPTYDSPKVTSSSLGGGRLAAPEFRVDPGAQLRQASNTALNVGVGLMGKASEMEHNANILRVDEATDKLVRQTQYLEHDKNAGFRMLKGAAALEKPDGSYLNLPETYGDVLKQHTDEIFNTLGNDAQKAAFQEKAAQIQTAFNGRLISHESNEYINHSMSVAEGIQSTAMRDITLNYNNPEVVSAAVDRIRAEEYRKAKIQGNDGGQDVEQRAQLMTSKAHRAAMVTALENNDPQLAESYLKKNAPSMTADDILAVKGHITKEMDNTIAVNTATEVVKKAQPNIQTSDAERAFNVAVLSTESNGQHFDKNGNVKISPAGAVGIAQVMPATGPEAAKLAGVKWDENKFHNDPDYNKALGMAYFQQKLKDNNGDLARAFAAYNAGQGNVNKAIKQADQALKNGEEIKNPDMPWLQFMPTETQSYVPTNLKKFASGEGQNPKATMAEIGDQLRNDPRLANNPTRYKAAYSEAERQFNAQQAAIKQKEDEGLSNAIQGLIENGGNISQLSLSVRSGVRADDYDKLLTFSEKLNKGSDHTDLGLYNKLASNPDSLARMTDEQFTALRLGLSDSDFKHFANERGKAKNGTGSNSPSELNSTAIKGNLDARLRMLNIDPTPKDDGGEEAARVGALRQFVDQYFINSQREHGKKFSDAEVSQHLDALFVKNATIHGWLSDSTKPVMGMKIKDVDSATRDNIRKAFINQGVSDPTDAQIMNAFWNMQVVSK